MNDTLDGEFRSTCPAGRTSASATGPVRLRRLVEHLTDEDLAGSSAPRLPQGLCRVQGRDRVHRRADGRPGPHDQGLDAGPRRRGAQHHPPGQEADRGGAADLPGPPGAADPGFEAQGRAVPPPRFRLGGGPLPRRAAPGARRAAPAADRAGEALPLGRAVDRRGVRRGSTTPSAPRWSSRPCATHPGSKLNRGSSRSCRRGAHSPDPLFKRSASTPPPASATAGDSTRPELPRGERPGPREGITEGGSMASFRPPRPPTRPRARR